jgi:Lsr2
MDATRFHRRDRLIKEVRNRSKRCQKAGRNPEGERPGCSPSSRRNPGKRRSGSSSSAGSAEDTAKIRAWAKEHGYEVNDRGRVSATVKEAYEKAN